MGTLETASRLVAKQVEKIIDEGTGKKRSVIVQMQSHIGPDEDFLQVMARVQQRRNLSVSPRELLPAEYARLEKLEAIAGARLTSSARRTLRSAEASLAIQVSPVQTVDTFGSYKAAGQEAISRLLAHDQVSKAIDDMLTKKQKKSSVSSEHVPTFWTSRSVALNVHQDILARLPKEVDGIQAIYRNRTLKIPRLVEIKSDTLPSTIQEEKASTWGLNKIGALAAWGVYQTRGKGVKVAVLDTGVDAEHPDLKGKVDDWAEFDEDGFEVIGSTAHDSDEHGTHCAGTIVGGNASGKWIGVVPEAKLAAAMVLPKGAGTDAQILAGIEWAIDQRVDVISMSLGGLILDVEAPDPYTRALISALSAGIPVVTAIGNDGNQTTGTPGNDWFAYAVGATDYRDLPAGFSGGRTHIVSQSQFIDLTYLPLIYSKPEVCAPGVAVLSSTPKGNWATFNGTSMATPHVAGAMALLLSATNIRNLVSGAQRAFLVQDLLTGTVEELGEAGQDHRYGFGRIDVLRAIGFAKEKGY